MSPHKAERVGPLRRLKKENPVRNVVIKLVQSLRARKGNQLYMLMFLSQNNWFKLFIAILVKRHLSIYFMQNGKSVILDN